jgi:hypothetical protein
VTFIGTLGMAKSDSQNSTIAKRIRSPRGVFEVVPEVTTSLAIHFFVGRRTSRPSLGRKHEYFLYGWVSIIEQNSLKSRRCPLDLIAGRNPILLIVRSYAVRDEIEEPDAIPKVGTIFKSEISRNRAKECIMSLLPRQNSLNDSNSEVVTILILGISMV